MERQRNVLTEVVASEQCCGCGVCAGVAAGGCLEMEERGGWYRPRLAGKCTGCGLCLEVCPRAAAATFDPGDSLGPVTGVYVGHSAVPGEREGSASGGLATRMLLALRERDWVDAVVVVAPAAEGWWAPRLAREAEEIRAAAGSKCGPVEFSAAVREMLATEGRYAVICLPCAARALRRAAARLPALGRRLRFVLALTCEHNVTRQYTPFLARRAGLREPARAARYRLKGGRDAYDYGFQATGASGAPSRLLRFGEWPQRLWDRRFFTPECCFTCADVFGAEADASFMDAWLPPYVADQRGTSLVVVRSAELGELLAEEISGGRVVAEALPPAAVVEAQASAIRAKHRTVRALLAAGDEPAGRLYAAPSRPAPEAGDAGLLAERQRLRQYARLSRRLYGEGGWCGDTLVRGLLALLRVVERVRGRLSG